MQISDGLINHLRSYEELNDEDIHQLVSISQTRIYKKGEFLIREGELCEEISFVHSGTLHSYYTSKSLEGITNCLVFPNDFVSAFSAFISNQKSQITIKTLTEVKISVFEKKQLYRLMTSRNNIKLFFTSITESYLIKLEKRFFQFQKDDAKIRYLELLNNHPKLILNIPLKLLASYLGITPRHLSRIRAFKN